MDPVCTKSGGATGGVPGQLPVQIEFVVRRTTFVHGETCRRRSVRVLAPRNKLRAGRVDVLGDAPAIRIVADVSEEIDIAAQSGQPDCDVQWAATDVLADDAVPVLDDVDERFADHQSAGHCTSASNVARAPLLCNESSVQR